MSVLRSLESKIAGLVEGTFSRAFRSEVRPVEIARRLAREMDQHRTPSVSRVYVPSGYEVYLGLEDRERFAGAEQEMIAELSAYLLEHARSERLVLIERPRISFVTDERLGLGEFGIKVEELDRGALANRPSPGSDRKREPRRERPEPSAPAPAVPAPLPVSAAAEQVAQPAVVGPASAALVAAGQRIELTGSGIVLGRSRSCDVVLEDTNASRRHAAVRPAAGGWAVEDLGSTNGVSVNGTRISGQCLLSPGDVVSLGRTELSYEQGGNRA
ncbi:MAG: DUF3662 and FHA domain-containing protein [Actinomycetes bacterium]